MKSGASDPFADDDAEEEQTSARSPFDEGDAEATTSADAAETPDTPADGDASRPADAADAREDSASDTENELQSSDEEDGEGLSREELPFILRRDKVKDERPEVHQLFVQRETHENAVDAERTLEKRLGEGLSRTDAREAIYLAGMRHLDDAEEILREWGYDL